MLNFSRTRIAALIVVCIAVAVGAGCSPQYYKDSADREVYGILEAKSARVVGMPEQFSVEQPEFDILEMRQAPEPSEPGPPPGPEGAAEEPEELPTVVISLEKALEIAALNSREYQTQKESLYTSALSLTLQRYLFDPQFFGILSGDYDNTDMDDEQVSGSSNFGFSWLLRTGARISVSLQTSLSEFLTGDLRRAASSVFSVSITQPLLQGAGITVLEPLTQAERNVIYQLRTFVRFRRTFFVRILTDYYGVVREAQIVENQRLNYENLKLIQEQAEWLAKAGEQAEFQVDQIRQRVLQAENGWVVARQRYQNALDRFKITLGLRTERDLELDPEELVRLAAEGVLEVDLPAERIQEIALGNRLDLMTQEDRVADAERKVKVAANDLLPGLDLSASLNTDTDGDSNPTNFQGDRTDLGAGIELDLPLDKLSERNEYRRRLISLAKARRDYQQARDEVVRDVREARRQYTRARKSYEIQQLAVELAQSRVGSTLLLLDAGRAIPRDVLEAQDDLLSAQNDLAREIVAYKVASLQLARDMGILAVGDKGQLREAFDGYN